MKITIKLQSKELKEKKMKYKLIEDKNGTIIDKNGVRYKLVKENE